MCLMDEKLLSHEADVGGSTNAIVISLYKSGNASLYGLRKVDSSTRLLTELSALYRLL